MTQPEVEKPETEIPFIPSEAGFSLNWQMIDANGSPVQVTMRGATADEWKKVVRERSAFIQAATNTGGWKFANAPKQASNLDAVEFPPSRPAPAPSAPAQTNGNGSELSKRINVIKVLPQPGDKVNIEFWATGRKYAELYAKGWALDRAKKLLAPVTQHNPASPAELSITCDVVYSLGKEYKPGKHYEDVQYIKA